jgi:hypothetical protein
MSDFTRRGHPLTIVAAPAEGWLYFSAGMRKSGQPLGPNLPLAPKPARRNDAGMANDANNLPDILSR